MVAIATCEPACASRHPCDHRFDACPIPLQLGPSPLNLRDPLGEDFPHRPIEHHVTKDERKRIKWRQRMMMDDYLRRRQQLGEKRAEVQQASLQRVGQLPGFLGSGKGQRTEPRVVAAAKMDPATKAKRKTRKERETEEEAQRQLEVRQVRRAVRHARMPLPTSCAWSPVVAPARNRPRCLLQLL